MWCLLKIYKISLASSSCKINNNCISIFLYFEADILLDIAIFFFQMFFLNSESFSQGNIFFLVFSYSPTCVDVADGNHVCDACAEGYNGTHCEM